MDVILLEDVKTLGKKGQIVKINDGYARNYVLPKKLGIEATAKNLNDLKLARKREEKEAAEELAAETYGIPHRWLLNVRPYVKRAGACFSRAHACVHNF